MRMVYDSDMSVRGMEWAERKRGNILNEGLPLVVVRP